MDLLLLLCQLIPPALSTYSYSVILTPTSAKDIIVHKYIVIDINGINKLQFPLPQAVAAPNVGCFKALDLLDL